MSEQVADALLTYQEDPRIYTRDVLGVKSNYDKQDEILLSVRDNPRTAVRAANGAGKTVVAAEAVLWATSCFRDALVVTTASTNRQVEHLLWGKINELYNQAPVPLGGECLNLEMRFPKLNTKAIGFATDDPGMFEGWHQKRIFIIVDEAKSVSQKIFDAVERCLGSGQWIRLLVISSPGGPTGAFYDIFDKRSHLYKCFHIPASASPFCRPDWIAQQVAELGEENPLCQSMVFGNFPLVGGRDTIIALQHLLNLLGTPPEHQHGEMRAGVDLAASGGDENTVAIFDGNKQVAMEAWFEKNTMATVGRVNGLIDEYKVPHDMVWMDIDGLGKPIWDRCVELDHKYNPFHSNAAPLNKKQYLNAIAEAWGNVANYIERREYALKDDAILKGQLTGRKRKERSDGRIQLESKEEARQRGVKSPDRADAVVMAIGVRRRHTAMSLVDPQHTGAAPLPLTPADELKRKLKEIQKPDEIAISS